jgi:heptosyltransferase-1
MRRAISFDRFVTNDQRPTTNDILSRFLIVRLGALGDIVHAIPVAAALRRAFPAARIDWLVSGAHRDILDLVPVVDRRVVIRDRPGAGGATLLAALGELRRARYDVAFDLQGLLKSAVLARASGAQRVIGFSSAYLRERIARLFYTEVYDPGLGGMHDARETRHVVWTNLGMLTNVGLTAASPEFPIEETRSDVANAIRDEMGGRYALLNPGAGWPNKQWPADRFATVARTLRERQGLGSIVAWGPGEEGLAQDVVRGAAGSVRLAPPTSIADLITLIRGAAVVIAGDTGPTQIAAAVGTPLVGIYGPTRPSRNGPWSPNDIAVSRAAECRCHHRRSCRMPRMCLLDIEADEVVGAVERRLAAGPGRV